MEDLKLSIPPHIYASVGQRTDIYHEHLVLSETPWKYRFVFQGDIGRANPDSWSVQPELKDAGQHEVTVTVTDEMGETLASGRTTVVVPDPTAGKDRNLNLLLVGDSLTHASVYPNEIARLLDRPDNPTWKMLGTHVFVPDEDFYNKSDHESGFVAQACSNGVRHEGYGGKTWNWHLTESKFCNEGQFDLNWYFDYPCQGLRPDVVTFLLGINDCFGADPKEPDACLNSVLDDAENLLQEFRDAVGDAALGVCLVPGPNQFEAAFYANYSGEYHRWPWKMIHYRLNQLMMERFDNRQAENIFVIPTNVVNDPVHGYPADNAVHPNTCGYKQIGAEIYSWLKAWMDQGL